MADQAPVDDSNALESAPKEPLLCEHGMTPMQFCLHCDPDGEGATVTTEELIDLLGARYEWDALHRG